ncbi:hypothetical protein [Streptomyces mutabilis]|uniref:hypothetical protein n=1 Tax=Streptomyces mutabilis TaxID=67332 RepID=UPI0011463C62|nr:hypothetical protein [Streptomyces mutabilis]
MVKVFQSFGLRGVRECGGGSGGGGGRDAGAIRDLFIHVGGAGLLGQQHTDHGDRSGYVEGDRLPGADRSRRKRVMIGARPPPMMFVT